MRSLFPRSGLDFSDGWVPGGTTIGGDGRMADKAGDDEGEDRDEGVRLDSPEVSASSIVERSAEMGGPGESARNTGALTPTSTVKQ
jgi:hypothetical protein